MTSAARRCFLSLLCTSAVLALGATPALAAPPAGFGEEGSGAGQLVEPRGIAVSQQSGDVFVADRNNNRADRFGGEGEFKLAWGEGVADGATHAPQSCSATCFAGLEGSGPGEFSEPEGVAVDNDPLSTSFEDVYFFDRANNRVEKFAPDGTFLLMFGGEVNETAVNKAGSTEAEKNVCTAASGDVCKAGTPGTGKGQFEPTAGALAVDSAGTVYVGDVERVQKFNGAGKYTGQLTLTGAGDVTAVAVDSAKELYVLSGTVAGVRKFEEGGAEVGQARDSTGAPSSIAVGASDELFVNDGPNSEGHHILEYDPLGTLTASFDSEGEGGSRGIAYANALNVLYVLNRGSVRLVTPPPPGPLVISQSSQAVGTTTATLNALVNPEGPKATSYHLEYGTSTGYGENTATTPLTGEPFEDQAVPVPAALTGLQTRTTYHFRVVVSNGTQTTDGPDQTFTTLPPVSIDSEFATQVTATSAHLEAELNPHGLASEYHFEYDTIPYGEGEAAHGLRVPAAADASAGAGTTDAIVSEPIQGLTASTTYYYRVLAHNSLGTVEGEDRTFTTQSEEPSGAGGLPDHRQWEMVSPPNKEGVSLEAITEEGGVIQAAADGSAMTYVAKAAIEAESPSNRSVQNTQVFSKRGASGWSSKDISTPHETIAILRVGFPSEYKLFSSDLSQGIVEPQGATPLSAQTSERTPYLRDSSTGESICTSNCYTPLVSGCPKPPAACSPNINGGADVPPGTEFGGFEIPPVDGGQFSGGAEYVTSSPDAAHIVLTAPQNLTEGYEGAGLRSLFEWTAGALQPVSVLPGGESTGEAGLEAGVGDNEVNMRGAVSDDGDRVVFETNGSSRHLYLRDLSVRETVQLDAVQGGAGGSAKPSFQGASSDASKVFFTEESRLTSDATAGPNEPDLYMCEIETGAGGLSCALTDLSGDAHSGEAANVRGTVSAIGEDGREVYFTANGVLAPGAVRGNCEELRESAVCNLYSHDTVTGQTRLVAELSGEDAPDWLGHRSKLSELTARTSPDGRYLAFMSERPLTGYDNTDAGEAEVLPGEGRKHADEEVYLYDSQGSGGAGTLVCTSCDPTQARPDGIFDPETFPGLLVDRPHTWDNRWLAGSVPGLTQYDVNQAVYQSRYLSDSGRMFFDSPDALVPQDANGKEDVYQYEPDGVGSCAQAGGCVSLISSGTSAEESAFMDASADGSDVFFITAAQLSQADIDNDFDIYDAHVCTSASPCPPAATSVPPPCATADSCRAAPGPQPAIFGQPPSATFNGSGNPQPPPAKPAPKAKPPTRAQILTKALKSCAKQAKKKRAACRARAQHRYGTKHKQAKQKPANRGRR